MDSIVGIMKKVAEQEARKIYTTELGIVTAIFPHKDKNDQENYQCSVKLKNFRQPDGKDFELRKIPIATSHLGMVNIPNVGDLVLVTFIGGDINAPVMIGRLYNDEDQPPINQEKEVLLQHDLKAGGSLKIDAEGTVTLTSKDEKNVITVKDEEISTSTATDQANITLKNKQCTISITGRNITIDNGTCKITVDSNGITLDAASSNVTIASTGAIEIGANAGSVQVGGTFLNNAVADNDEIILSEHTHVGNLGAPCPIMIPTEKINSAQAKNRITKVG
jgi:phage baseplate assembly protein gpV